jgi:hypothetical protein
VPGAAPSPFWDLLVPKESRYLEPQVPLLIAAYLVAGRVKSDSLIGRTAASARTMSGGALCPLGHG